MSHILETRIIFPNHIVFIIKHKTFGCLPLCHREVLNHDHWYLMCIILKDERTPRESNWKNHLPECKGSSPEISREVGLVKVNVFPLSLDRVRSNKNDEITIFGPLKKNILHLLKILHIYFSEIHHIEVHLKYQFLNRYLFHWELSVFLLPRQSNGLHKAST